MSQKSIEAYETILPKVGSIKREIYSAILDMNECGWEANIGGIDHITKGGQYTKYQYSTITARLSELWDEGLIMPKEGETISRFTSWVIVPAERVDYVKRMRRNEKLRKWFKKGLEFSDLLPEEVVELIKKQVG